MKQIFDYSLMPIQWHPPERFWKYTKGVVVDPYRRDIFYPEERAVEYWSDHQKKSRKAIIEANIVG